MRTDWAVLMKSSYLCLLWYRLWLPAHIYFYCDTLKQCLTWKTFLPFFRYTSPWWVFKAYISLLLLHWTHTSCMGGSAFHLLCTEESMLDTEDKSTLSCANSNSKSCYWVKNMHSFLNSFMLYFHYVPYIVFRFLLWYTVAGAPPCALSNIWKTYRLSLWSLQVEIAPLCCSCNVSKSLDWKLIGSDLF